MNKTILTTLAFTGLMTFSALTARGAQSQQIHVNAPTPTKDRAVTLGAGDDLGRACFSRYVTVVRDDQQLKVREATAPAPRPAHVQLIARADETSAVHHIVAGVLDQVLVKLAHNA